MKKISILSLHLGYGGIEKSVVNLANLLVKDYEVEIISTYKLDHSPAFEIDSKVKVTYLIEKYKPNREEWKHSLKKLKPITFIKETYKALVVLFLRRSKTTKAIKNCNSDIIISTRDLFNKWLGEYGKKKTYKIGWEHNHHHQDVTYINKVVTSCKKLDALVLVSDSLRSFYKKEMKKRNYKCKCVYIPNMLDKIPEKLSSLTEKRIVSIGRLSREKGFTDEITKNHPNIEIVNISHENEDFTMEKMADAVFTLYPDIEGYFCTNEAASEAVLSATDASGKELAIVGFDSGEVQRNAVENGTQIGFIAQNPYGMGYAAVIAGVRADLGLTVDTFINTSFQWIDSSNIENEEYSSYFYG